MDQTSTIKTKTRRRRARTAPATRPHSIRTTDELWEASEARAKVAGQTMNHVVNQLLEGYSRNLIQLPEVTTTYAAPQA